MDKRIRYVYVISSDTGFQKIGWSVNLVSRLRGLNHAHPTPLSLFFYVPHEDAPAIERRAHRAIAADRAQGEWFRVTPDRARAAVLAAVAARAHVRAWVRAPRQTSSTGPAYAKPNPHTRWTAERQHVLALRWSAGVSTRHILAELAALPGGVLSMSAVSKMAGDLGIARPEGFTSTNDSRTWTVARDAYVRTTYAAGCSSDEILRVLNALPGNVISHNNMVGRVRRLGCLRSAEYIASIAVRMRRKLRDPRWTDEREMIMESAYPDYVMPVDILAAITAAPGPAGITWEVVRERAKHLGLHRPKDFAAWHRNTVVDIEHALRYKTTQQNSEDSDEQG